MKKNYLFIACIVLLVCIAVTACDSPVGWTVFEAGRPLTLKKDVGICVNDTWYPVSEDAKPLLKALGNDYELFSEEDDAKEFAYEHCSVLTNHSKGKDIWYAIELYDATLCTARGIKVGDAVDKVYGAYGDKYYWEDEYLLIYFVSGAASGDLEELKSPYIAFTVEEGIVMQILICFPTNVSE